MLNILFICFKKANANLVTIAILHMANKNKEMYIGFTLLNYNY